MRKFQFSFEIQKALSRALFDVFEDVVDGSFWPGASQGDGPGAGGDGGPRGEYSSASEAQSANEGVPGVPLLHSDGTYTYDTSAEGQSSYYLSAGLASNEEMLGIQAGLAEGQLAISQQQQDIANDRYEFYKANYQPVEEEWIAAATAGLPADYYVSRAAADVDQSFSQADAAGDRQAASYGIDPSSDRYMAIEESEDIQKASAKAGAMTNARMGVNDVNYQRRSDVVKTGLGIPTESASALASASSTLGQASNTYATGYGGVSQAYNELGNYYANTANQNAANEATTDAAKMGAIGTGVGVGVGALAAFCWVAREVYSVENPKWLQFRQWMLYRSPKWFRAMYIKHGAAFAEWLKGRTRLKAIIRSWMDSIIERDSRRIQSWHLA